ncbi:acyl-CoA synthetase [Natrinema gelatinilyticum]|uniref:acyl-CoA synthetase n=1 Tax=Natrinema gelatinilyticum TaxID=2961571 RepID=UPI0020C1CE51|nr:AMP-binding protein [Natrinema gelatinilyticum]
MAWFLEFEDESYEAACEAFEWDLPAEYNIARDCVRKHDRDAVALYQGYPDGRRETYTFGDVDDWSNRVAGGLRECGIDRGDCVAITLGQRPETLVSHLACWKLGVVSVPLSPLFGDEALHHRLADSGASVAIIDRGIAESVAVVRESCPDLAYVITVDPIDEEGERAGEDRTLAGDRSFDELEADTASIEIASTTPDEPAVVIYTSGTTGKAKGVVHGQAIWRSYCPAFRLYFECPHARPTEGIYWTPSDWAWIGGLGTVVFPAWHYGRPVVGRPIRSFDADTAYGVLESFGVTHASLPPTALRMLREEDVSPSEYDLSLEAIVSGSEPLTPEAIEWVDEAFDGVVVNEGYGQTEIGNAIVNCQSWFELQPGSMGKPVPGYDVAILDRDATEPVPAGTIGEIAIRADGNPGVFQRYWGEGAAPDRTDDGWHRTGDLARRDEDGYVWFVARDDDLIVSSGYRIAPSDVERALLSHEAVTGAGVVGIPDDRRGERVAAFVTLAEEANPSEALHEGLRNAVREDVAKYAYPREITFVDRLPTTRTGKTDRRALVEREE